MVVGNGSTLSLKNALPRFVTNWFLFLQLITDFGWGFTGDIQVKSQSETSDVFYYNMGYRSDKAKAVVPEWMGEWFRISH